MIDEPIILQHGDFVKREQDSLALRFRDGYAILVRQRCDTFAMA